ncbi:MAG: M28 family peptidase [Pirellulales bacterium]
MQNIRWQFVLATLAALPTNSRSLAQSAANTTEAAATSTNPFDGTRAFRYLEELCALGPRYSGSPGMTKQQKLLVEHFQQLGGQVSLQEFRAKNPLGGTVDMANIIVQWHPERKDRILLAAHYDTRPLPDRDPNPVARQRGTFVGASDGASGTAVLMELAHLMPGLDSKFGVDFVLFDGEELVYQERRDPYCLGSTWFARQYVAKPPEHRYHWGVLLDMVGDSNLTLYYEKQSYTWRDTRPLVESIWETAKRLGVKEFVPRIEFDKIADDHVPLRNIAKIPTCDVIDIDYFAWHTEADTPSSCSSASLAKVGWVMYEWLRTVQ